MSRYLSCAWVRPPGAGLGVSDGAGVGWFPLSMPRTASAYVAGRVHVFAQRKDLVVDPAGVEDPLLRFVPARCAGRELVLLPHHDPGRPVGMRDPHELAAEPLELDL